MQLVAYGAQDIYLTGNPQITFFKVVYRRHTNFSCESIKQTFNGTNSFGSTVTATISRNGDLVTNMYLQFELPALNKVTIDDGGADNDKIAYTNEVANALVKEVELEIGGQRIDKHYSEWLSIWSELNLTQSQKGETIFEGYNSMVGRNTVLEEVLTADGNNAADNIAAAITKDLEDKAAGTSQTDANDITYYTPLRFWFNRNPGLALPLIALQYHEVKVRMTFRERDHLLRHGTNATGHTAINSTTCAIGGGAVTLKNAALWVDYVYLDTDERRRFAQVSHEYLIEQLQEHRTSVNATSANVSLNFNHPVKELVWVFVRSARETGGVALDNPRTGNQWLNFESNDREVADTLQPTSHFDTATLKLNGHERFEPREASYFNLVQPLQHHTCAPQRQVYVYSFALKPEEHQPSGTCNFSRIDNAQLELKGVATGARTLRVYAVNYNVLRIMSGMGGLAYSN